MTLVAPTAMLGTGTWVSNDASPDVLTVDPTAAALMVYMAHIGTGVAVTSVSDTIGDTGGTAWASRVDVVDAGVSRMVIYTRTVGTGGSSGTVTLNLAAVAPRGAHGVMEVTGQASTATSENDSKITEDSAGAITLDGITIDAGNIIVCCAGTRGTHDIAAGSNTSEITQVDSGDSGRSISFCTATGDPTWTGLDGSVQFAAALEIVVSVGTVIANSRTAYDNAGERKWTGKSHSTHWWNTYQARWDGVLPYDEAGGNTIGDNFIAKDISGTVAWTTIELDDRTSGRMTVFWDNGGKRLYAISFHDTAPEYWEIAYNSDTDTYSFSVGTAGSGETPTGMLRGANNAVHSGSIYVVPNGDVWVALLTASGLILNRRTGGAWNASVVNLDIGIDQGVAVLNHFVNGGATNVWVFSAEDDAVANSEFNAYFIDQDAAAPFTAGNWTEDTVVAQTIFSTDSDNHLSCVRDSSNNIYIALKTGAGVTGETLIGLLKRTAGGTYTGHTVVTQPAASADNRTRPVIALDAGNQTIYIAYNKEVTGDLEAWYVTADLSDLDTWSAETLLFSIGTRDFGNVRAPQADFAATNASGLLFLAAQDLVVGTNDDDVYYTLLEIESSSQPVTISAQVAIQQRAFLFA